MVVPYSGTMYSCREYIEKYLREDVSSHPFGDNLLYPTNYLAQIVWHQIDRTVIKAREAMTWLQQISRLASLEDLPVTWTTPSGFIILQQYREINSRRVETKLGESIVKLKVASDGSRLSRRRQRSGISPNYIHGLDAAMMSLVTCKLKSQGVHHFCMVHDSHTRFTPQMFKDWQRVYGKFSWKVFRKTFWKNLSRKFRHC